MSYLKLYRKKLNRDGNNIREKRLNDSKNALDRNFVAMNGYRECTLLEHMNFTTETRESVPFEIVVKSETDELKKTFLLRPNITVSNGSYISFEGRTYIIKETNIDPILPTSSAYLCNREIKLHKDDDPIPCYTNSTTYGSKGILDQEKFYELDSKTKIFIQRNEVTENMYIGQRIMFGSRYVYKITEMDDLVYPQMFICVAQRDENVPMDDFENNVAWNPYEKPTTPNTEDEDIVVEITGVNKIKLGETFTYESNLDVEWDIDDPTIATITHFTNNTVELMGVKRGWVTLTATTVDGIVGELNIMIC